MIGLLVLIAGVIVIALVLFGPHHRPPGHWSQAQLLSEAAAGHVRQVQIGGAQAIATDRKGHLWDVNLSHHQADLTSRLRADGVPVRPRSGPTGLQLVGWLALLALTVVLVVLAFVYWISRSPGPSFRR